MVNIRTSRSWIEVDLDAITHNLDELSSLLNKNSSLMVVVKAEGYGHGLVEVAKHCQKMGIEAFAVATIDEGIKLREHGIYGEILVLGYSHPIRAIELHNYRLIQTIVNREHARQLNESGHMINVHIKIDTGMHRLGFDLSDYESIKEIYDYQFIHIQGYFTHLCVCDSKRKVDQEYTQKQIAAFYDLINELKFRHYDIGKVHLQSSYGLVNYPEINADYARVGILMYGVYSTFNDYSKVQLDLKPALTIKAQIAMLHYLTKGASLGYGLTYKVNRDSVIAVIPYFGWARQDRKDKPRVSIGAKLVADLLSVAGIDRLITMDLHADQIQGFFNIPVDHLYASAVFLPYIQSLKLDELVIATPDVGGSKRASTFSKYLGVPLVLCNKSREKANEVASMQIIGDVKGKNVVLIDDIVDTAGTITKAANIMLEAGANSVRAIASHCVMSDPASFRVQESGLTEMVFTDSIPYSKKCVKVKQLSIADMFAETIKRVMNNESISSQYII